MKFRIGAEVVLIRPHIYNGRPYSHEARVGDVGLVVDPAHSSSETAVHVRWLRREGGWTAAGGTRTSWVDDNCLALFVPIIVEEPDLAELPW